ncbi:MAG: hypothetical protein PHC61_17125 [Chitinivibrionales bacterium]|nr:hypothetical protein [Chitinivibrionales bacterium]
MQAIGVVELALLVCLFAPVPAAIYLLRLGLKTLKHQAYPYPGQKVIHDTHIVRGAQARRRGRAFIIMAVVSFVMSVTSAIITHYYVTVLRSPVHFNAPAHHAKTPPQNQT